MSKSKRGVVSEDVEESEESEGGLGAPVADSGSGPKDHNKVVSRLEAEINRRTDIGWGSCDKDVVDDIRLALRNILAEEYGG